jgi:hypothetical protein
MKYFHRRRASQNHKYYCDIILTAPISTLPAVFADLAPDVQFDCIVPPIRIVQGIQLINNSWFYTIEWISPGISEKGDEVFTSRDSIARVTDYDLERVRL